MRDVRDGSVESVLFSTSTVCRRTKNICCMATDEVAMQQMFFVLRRIVLVENKTLSTEPSLTSRIRNKEIP